MSDFKKFMKAERQERLSKEYEISVGDFEEVFKVRAIGFKEFSEIQDRNTTQQVETVKSIDPKTKKRKREKQVTNRRNEAALYMDLCKAGITYPDLENAELQDFYGAMTPEELLNNMLTINEIAEIADFIIDNSNLPTDINDKIDEAKN